MCRGGGGGGGLGNEISIGMWCYFVIIVYGIVF